MPAIEVTGLQRAFSEEVLAVAGIDLEVAEGEIYGFLGPERRRQDDDGADADHAAAPDRRARARVAGYDVVKRGAARCAPRSASPSRRPRSTR